MKTKHAPSLGSARSDDGNAFLPDPTEHRVRSVDGTESFAEEYIASALTGGSISEDARDEIADDEDGGPYLVLDEDGSLPTTEREPASLDAMPENHPRGPGAAIDAFGSVDSETDGERPNEPARGGLWIARGA